MRAAPVVVPGVFGQDILKVASAEDECTVAEPRPRGGAVVRGETDDHTLWDVKPRRRSLTDRSSSLATVRFPSLNPQNLGAIAFTPHGTRIVVADPPVG
jgi:hypothetical protein